MAEGGAVSVYDSARSEILTDRLIMRRWREEDREPFARMGQDTRVMEYFPALMSRSESDALADRADGWFDLLGFGLWALELRSTGQFIGFTGLAPLPDDILGAGRIEIGWRLAAEHWHQGLATEAASAALDLGFGRFALPRVESITAQTNARSQAVMLRLGMRRAAVFEHPRIPEGSPLRTHVHFTLERPTDLEGDQRAK